MILHFESKKEVKKRKIYHKFRLKKIRVCHEDIMESQENSSEEKFDETNDGAKKEGATAENVAKGPKQKLGVKAVREGGSANADCVKVADGEGCTGGPEVSKEQKRFSQKLANLQEKTKTLRAKLGFCRSVLQQQSDNMQPASAAYHINDELARKAMATLEAIASKDEVSSSSRVSEDSVASTSAAAGSQKGKQEQSKPRRKTRRELQEQVEGLQELIYQLTFQNGPLKARVCQLMQNNPKLQQIEIFPVTGTTTTTTTPTTASVSASAATSGRKRRQDSERSATSSVSSQPRESTFGKQRHESGMSNASLNTSQKDTTTAALPNNEGSPSKSKKRNGRKKKNKNKATKSEASEMEALAKYINTIIAEYLGEPRKEKAKELEFKGGIEDLESYAQLLVKEGLGRIVEEEIRINRKNNRQSFITMCADRESSERDGIILLPVARRYAFEGDIVRAFVMNASVTVSAANSNIESSPTDGSKKKSTECNIKGGKNDSFCIADDEDPYEIDDDTESPDSDVDPTDMDATTIATADNCPKSFVISIVKQTELRQVVGTISFKNPTKLNGEQSYYKLKPHDMRVPMVYIPESSCASHVTAENKGDISGFLYLAQVRETDSNGHCIGELIQAVGKVGNLEAEIKAILLHNGLKDIKPYEERFNEMFAEPDGPITEKDLHQREDLRKQCIFTIDPLTARDLDDAMSVEKLNEEEYEIGVHISDVAFYLEENSELDNIVKDRATSIYLVNEVIHMLPQTLCFKCSLLPGVDKFAFSVFWRFNGNNAEVLGKPRFTRSVVNSCSQFAYEHAQKIIDHPKEKFDIDDFPTIHNGFTVGDVVERVRKLHAIAQKLRDKRYESGALSINNPKIRFNLDPKTGEPGTYEVEDRQDANFLIEEFMLLANQTVARFIYDTFPDISILRNHAPPLSKSMNSLREKLSKLGYELDCSSSKSIYASMQRICREAKDPKAMDACLSTLLTKPMARAKYFCSEGKTEESDLWHYALSIPIYTHFTSPIRRYPDILVHRLLAAALNYCPPPKRTTDELHKMAQICNEQKYNAKNAGDESVNLFFKRFIKAQQSIILRAVVTEICQHLINVVVIETGHAISIRYKMQKVLVDTSNVPAYILISEKNSKIAPIKLQMFSTVDIKLVIWDEKICGFFVSPDPKQRQLNSIELSKKKQQTQQQQQAQQVATVNACLLNGENDMRKVHRNAQRNVPAEQQQNSDAPKAKLKQKAKPPQQRVYALRESESN